MYFHIIYIYINPVFECYFVKADPNIETTYVIEDKTIYIKCEESFENIFYKTQEAFKIFEDKLDNYDYILRTNLSSCIIFHKYKNWLETLPKTKVYNGSIHWHGRYIYASGSAFTCSPDVIKIFLESKTKQYIIDDITYGKICMEHNILLTSAPLNHIFLETFQKELEQFNQYECAFHFRIKSGNRNNDLQIYYKLLNIYYNIDDLK